jgi:hypothetical protein
MYTEAKGILIALPQHEEVDGVNTVVGFIQIPVIAFYNHGRGDAIPITVHGVLNIKPSERFYKFENQIFFYNADFGYLKEDEVLQALKNQYQQKDE